MLESDEQMDGCIYKQNDTVNGDIPQKETTLDHL